MVLRSHTAKETGCGDCDITASAPVLAAIDLSKERHEVLIEVLIEAPDKKRGRRVSVLNNFDEFDRLISLLRSNQRPVRVAFKATGNYHRALAYQFGSAGFEIKLISSIALPRTREALHNSWDKNDPKDAQVTLGSRRAPNHRREITGDECHVETGPSRRPHSRATGQLAEMADQFEEYRTNSERLLAVET